MAKHSKKVFDIQGNTTNNGGNLMQYYLHAGLNQQVIIQKLSFPYYRLKMRHSGKCLRVNNTSNGGNIFQVINYFIFSGLAIPARLSNGGLLLLLRLVKFYP
jgi:hypothetical protein